MTQTKNKKTEYQNENLLNSNKIKFDLSKNKGKTKPIYPRSVGALHYPESISQELQWKPPINSFPEVSNDEETFDKYVKPPNKKIFQDSIYRCTKSLIWGETKKNNYYKIITCGREWCKDCGQMHSYSHDRKIARLLKKFSGVFEDEKTQNIGYLVVTVPNVLKEKFYSKEVLNDFRNYWRRKLKNLNYDFGLIRYHWAGEDGYTWKPHLNILIPENYIEIETLKKWRLELSNWFKDYFSLDYRPAPNLFYSYTTDEKKMNFWISYITRPTQLIYRELNCNVITGYRNTAPFGKFPPEKIQDKPEEQGIEIDPNTGEKELIIWRMKWNSFKNRMQPETIPIQFIRENELEEISKGFWREPKILIEKEKVLKLPDI